MKMNQYLMIIGAIKGFGKAMTFDREKHLSTVVLVALSDKELKRLSASINKEHQAANHTKVDVLPRALNSMVMLVNKLVPDPLSESLRYLRFAGCMQRPIYLS